MITVFFKATEAEYGKNGQKPPGCMPADESGEGEI